MRWLLLTFSGLALLCAPVAAQPDSLAHRFEAANAAYEQGRYARAADLYREILDTGAASGALYYNLGNAYVRLDRLGQAIRHYEKAGRLRPSDPRVQHNLEQARRQAGVYPGRLPPRGLQGLVQDWSPLALLVAGMLLLGSGGVMAVIRAGGRRNAEVRHPLVWAPAAAGLLLVAVSLGTSYVQAGQQRAVVVADRAPLRASPTATAAPDTTLPEGTLLEMKTHRTQWHEVHLANGMVGWVPARALGDV